MDQSKNHVNGEWTKSIVFRQKYKIKIIYETKRINMKMIKEIGGTVKLM